MRNAPGGKDRRRITEQKGKTVPVKRSMSEEEVLTAYQVTTSGCWEYTGHRDPNGYGRVPGPRTRYAHRFFYEALVGPIPDGLTIDHLCRFTSCVNPDHLEPVPLRVNILRSNNPFALNARKTHCKRGHKFTTENTVHGPRGRQCLRCRRARINRHDAITRHGIDRPVEFYLAKSVSS